MSPDQKDISDFLRPETVSRLANMDLRARLIVEGFIAGLHKSPYHGFSVEFAEYRQYNAGESTRNIDWKTYAKTDRYYTKIFEDETHSFIFMKFFPNSNHFWWEPPVRNCHDYQTVRP